MSPKEKESLVISYCKRFPQISVCAGIRNDKVLLGFKKGTSEKDIILIRDKIDEYYNLLFWLDPLVKVL